MRLPPGTIGIRMRELSHKVLIKRLEFAKYIFKKSVMLEA